MTRYCIVSAKPKGATNHINSRFKVCEFDAQKQKWFSIGWKSIGEVSNYLDAGHGVVTAKVSGNNLALGAPVELELRISKNDTNFKISDMPDS